MKPVQNGDGVRVEGESSAQTRIAIVREKVGRLEKTREWKPIHYNGIAIPDAETLFNPSGEIL